MEMKMSSSKPLPDQSNDVSVMCFSMVQRASEPPKKIRRTDDCYSSEDSDDEEVRKRMKRRGQIQTLTSASMHLRIRKIQILQSLKTVEILVLKSVRRGRLCSDQ